MRNPDEAVYTVAKASEIARLEAGTGRSWVAKDWVRLSRKDKAARVPGATTLLSGRRVLQMAIAAAAVNIGVHPKIACAAARNFTDLGDETRVPGELFEGDGQTALVIYPNGSNAVVKVNAKTCLLEIFFPRDPVAAGIQSRYETASVLLLDFIVDRVEKALAKFDREEAD